MIERQSRHHEGREGELVLQEEGSEPLVWFFFILWWLIMVMVMVIIRGRAGLTRGRLWTFGRNFFHFLVIVEIMMEVVIVIEAEPVLQEEGSEHLACFEF